MKSKISILFFILTSLVFPNDPIKIISSDFRSILVEFTPVYSKTFERDINNQKFLDISFVYGYHSGNWGEPAVPEYNFNVGVPSETGSTIEILNSVYTEMEGRITPLPKLVKDGDLDRYEYELNENYYNYVPVEELVSFGEFGISRDVKIQGIKVLPVKFNPSAGKIRLYSKIIFRINFPPSTISSEEQKDELVEGSVVNYQVAKFWKPKTNRLSKVNVINGVLAEGTWYKFETPQEGFYRITRSMLSSYGIDANTVDPRTIKIYNNGGKMLPENAGSPRPVDLVENAIWVVGEEDSRFDESDYILFYGRGNSFWDYDTTTKTIKRFFHLYSNSNYYFITSGGAAGKRIQDKPSLNTTPGFLQTSTNAFADWEVDRINKGQSGRLSLGDVFSQSTASRIYMNNLDNRIESQSVTYNFRFVNSSEVSLQLRIYENNNQIYTSNISGYGSYQYSAGIQLVNSASFIGSLPESRSVLKFEITANSASSVGYLDYFEIRYLKELKPVNNYLLFFSYDTTSIIEYQLRDFPNTSIKVFDVTDFSNVKSIVPKDGWPSGGEFRFQADENEDLKSRYLAVGSDDFKTPSNPVQVSNSNVRGISDGARFIIITHKNFIEAANKLKTYRESEAPVPISTIVVDVQEIFNEFSCGISDVSGIRDFLKYAYSNWINVPEYVLFFGGGTYDYKNLEGYNDNYISTWQTTEGLNLLNSYTSDDFFVKLDPGDDKIDIAPGRITVKNLNEANKIVDKIIEYENNSEIGSWRNLITLVADDIYTSSGPEQNLHTPQSESYTRILPDYLDFNKIYMVKYPTVLTGNGKRMPEVNKRIIESMNEGTIVINYVGHGNPELWAHEVVFDRNISIPQLRNQNKYFFLIAATCSFGYYDIPNFRSASEDLVLLQNAGSIAALTTSRLVFSIDNAALNSTFYRILFNTPRDSEGYSLPIGKANYLTKQQPNIGRQDNVEKYYILGDPTLRLNIPLYQASIDSLNGQTTVSTEVQIKALGKVNLNGLIKRPDNSLWEDYNGEGILTVYDSEREEIYSANASGTSIASFVAPGGVIFRGRISIVNGKFNADFIVPKDISYENNRGKIVLYFFRATDDGLGYTDKIIVGGTDTSTVNDGVGPKIEIYFDDPSYVNSSLINPDSRLIVKLSDETGINTTGTGVGHQLEGILNDNSADPIDFSGYFTGDLDVGGRSGEINYAFSSLETGNYKLDVKAWDVFNNSSLETAYFSVVTGDDLVIHDLYNYPNPFSSSTTFTFQQNLNSDLNIEVKVYTIAGRLIKVINSNNINQRFVTIDWDGRDDDGDLIANGTYLYKLIVKTTDGQYSRSILGKLAVIR